MKKTISIFTLLLAFLGSIASQFETGIWVGPNSEVVRTEKFCIIFSKCDNKTISKCYIYSNDGNTLKCDFIGEIVFSDSTIIKKKLNFSSDSIINGKQLGTVTSGVMEIVVNDELKKLTKLEEIKVVKPYKLQLANSENVGECLRIWNVGSDLSINEKDQTIELKIGTKKHWYIFNVTENYIYCRAARLEFNDKGALFAQNIRLWHGNNNHTAYIANKNDSVCAAELKIDNSLFKADACTFDKAGIYWSLIDFSKKQIKLNGCGMTYKFGYVAEDSKNRHEWFDIN